MVLKVALLIFVGLAIAALTDSWVGAILGGIAGYVVAAIDSGRSRRGAWRF